MGMTAEELIHELPKGLMKWQNFNKKGNALYITAFTDFDSAIIEALRERGIGTECVSIDGLGDMPIHKYHYIVVASAMEKAKAKACDEGIFKMIHERLHESGILFLLTDNRLAIRYFCGDKDPYTGRNFDGIENYMRISSRDSGVLQGQLYSKAELIHILEGAGFAHHRFYSVFPEIACPQILISEDYTPVEELKIRIFPQYHNPDTVFLEEENLYTSLSENNMLHTMANGFLIECPLDGNFSNAYQITMSTERGKENALCTVIREDRMVEKRPLYEEGVVKLSRLKENNDYLAAHGVRMIPAQINRNSFIMPFTEGIPLAKYFRTLAGTDKNAFYAQFNRLWELILSSSEHVPYGEVDWEHFDPRWDEEPDEKKRNRIDRSVWSRAAFGTDSEKEALGTILKRGYIDLVLLNGLMSGDNFVFYDQEMYIENMPAKAVLYRNINFLYHGDMEMEKIIPKQQLMECYGVWKYQELFYAYERSFLNSLRNDILLSGYHKLHRRNFERIHSNRQRMNYSTEEYLRLFVNIFSSLNNKKLYLFGSGNFSKKFLALYGRDYEVYEILDNDRSKWGSRMEGIMIAPPFELQGQDASTYKVIICIKNYVGVLKQLRELGAVNIGIYDTNMEYPRKSKTIRTDFGSRVDGTKKKKYHTGYVAGVFDLFHMGHLNLLRRAKEQCDYLIAGVVTDEGVRRGKQTESFIPFEERLKIVQACRYVDEAVAIPPEFADTKDAYLKFQFDVQFSGSDYANDPVWLEKREFLRKHGAELIFFPYTEGTSSTKIKEMIEKKLV